MRGRNPAGRSSALSALVKAVTLGALLLGLPGGAGAAALPQQSGHVDLLTEANVEIQGAAASDTAGRSVAPAGDVNGDGKDDVIVGAPAATGAGTAYVIFGRSDQATIDLNSLGSAGFAIVGAASGDRAGTSVDGIGDMNSDGKDDVIVGADGADNGGTDRGSAYVVFGKATTTQVNLGSLGSGGFRIDGSQDAAGVGQKVAGAGDVNDDNAPDVIVASQDYDPLLGTDAGSAWVLFGKSTATTVDLGNLGSQGFQIEGARPLPTAAEQAGSAVDGIADLNADGKDDLLVGARGADNNSRLDSGSVYVVFGQSAGTTIDLGNIGTGGNSQGYRIDGAAASDAAGTAVASTGNIGGDGLPDLVIGTEANKAHEVFGKGSTTTVDLNALGAGGFSMSGAGDFTGRSVAGAGDLNSDAKPDILLGASQTDENSRTDSGSAYLVFGKSTTANVNLATLGVGMNTEGFRVDGAQADDRLGFSVGAAGDFNGDGPADLFAGANLADRNSRTDSGAAYVVYGWETAAPTTTLNPGGPTGTVNTKTASFSFSGSDPSVPITLECKLDAPGTSHDQAFATCISPKSYTAADIVDDGAYTFSVRAIDRFGNVDPSPETRTWTVDTTGPTVSITGGPSGTVNTKPASFSFGGSDQSPPISFQCSLDRPAPLADQGFAACSSPKNYTASDIAADGTYTFSVRGVDSLGNVGATVTRTWTVDTTGPTVTIDSQPPASTNQKSANFTFHSNEAGFFACSLDAPGTANDQGVALCDPNQATPTTTGSKAYTASDLPTDGQYVFKIFAADVYANVGPTASRTWKIDATPPVSQILSGPSGTTISTTARFTFGSEGGSNLQCKLDAAAYQGCLSPKVYQDLALGQHTFSVRATDSLGNLGNPASRTWTVEAAGTEPCSNTITGTNGDDTLEGSMHPELILGRDGDDLIDAKAGADCVFGGAGVDEIEGGGANDQVLGEEGDDLLSGGGGRDVVGGGSGRDILMGGSGIDKYRGGGGNDTFYTADGRAESVICGAGTDTVQADTRDQLTGCERVTRVRSP